MEKNNDIFLAGGDDLVYLAKLMHKKYSTTFVWGRPFSMYVSYGLFFNPLPLYAPLHILEDPAPFLQSRKYLMDGLFLNQKTNKKVWISYSLNVNIRKKIVYEKINGSVGWNKHSGDQC